MNITIHRGTHEIGGTCIQITSGGRSILLDAGLPLGESLSHVDLNSLEFTDLFISHPHQDHYGLIDGVKPNQTVHIGGLGKKLIDATKIFLGGKPLEKKFNYLRNREWVELDGVFRVRPYLMDHSCVDAFGFLVEAEGKRIYYSGDFRAHGHRERAFTWFLANPPKDVDVLLMEGTMMERDNHETPSEKAVESQFVKTLHAEKDRPCFLICSGQHIDRLCVAYRACLQTGRTLVLDMYTAFILRAVSSQFPNVPDINWKDSIRVLVKGKTASGHYSRIMEHREFFGNFVTDVFARGTEITLEELKADPAKYLIKVSTPKRIIDELESCAVIYSMWSGYLEKEEYKEIQGDPKVNFHIVHTSGHATRRDLLRFVNAVKPKRLIPVHTEYPEKYKDYFKGYSVEKFSDGQVLTV